MTSTLDVEPARRVVAASIMSTISAVFPGFLVGALAVQVRAEFDVSEAIYGWGLGSFFLASTLGSVALGEIAQRIGARRQIVAALITSALAQLGIAAVADSFAAIVAFLVVAGVCNAANQTAVNLFLAQARLPRLGLAVALKQSGMPTASLLCGLMVPALALTVGWRWAYVFGAGVAAASTLLVLGAPDPQRAARRRLVPASPTRILVIAAVTGTCLSFAAGATNSWLVSSGVEAGMSEGAAGLLLSFGALAGISMRLFFGFRLDSMSASPFRAGAILALIGSLGLASLSFGVPAIHVVATLVAFGSGWVWPIFTNYGIVRANGAAAAAATGITQMGVYVGVFSAPLVTGWIIDHHGYRPMWLVVAALTVVGSVLALSIQNEF
ncbi:MAG: MFS transporter [Acidimicrobiales bacterium]